MYHMRRHYRTGTAVCGMARGARVLVPANFRMKLIFSPSVCCPECKVICEEDAPRK